MSKTKNPTKTKTKTKTKQIFDGIWGSCTVSPLCQMFIDTYEFQRMRNMKQLGASYFVFSSASGNRFEHSIGVGHLARTWAKHLQETCPDLTITDRFVELLQIAGLMHDIGHGPFSHVFDKVVREHDSNNRIHENRSKNILRYMVRKYKIPLTKEEQDFLCSTFKPSVEQKKQWMFQIIAGDIDADRMDYIIRDQQNIGIQTSFTTHQAYKIIKNSTICNNTIVFNDEVKNDIEDLLSSRDYLYNRIYNHHVSTSIERMLEEVFAQSENLYKMKKSVDCVEQFIRFDDSILMRIYWDPRVQRKTTDIIDKIWKRQFKEYYSN